MLFEWILTSMRGAFNPWLENFAPEKVFNVGCSPLDTVSPPSSDSPTTMWQAHRHAHTAQSHAERIPPICAPQR